MTAMHIFVRCKYAESDKKAMRDRITRYRESATRMSAALDGVGARSTAEPDKLAAILAEIDSLEREIKQRDQEYAAEVAAACKLLDMLPEVECEIVNRYYIGNTPLTIIARDMSYSYGYVRTIISTARGHLEDIPEAMVASLLPSWYLDAFAE